MNIYNLTPYEKLKRARIQLLDRCPFFGNLSMHINFKEVKDCPALAGISPDGEMIYNPEMINKISSEEAVGLVFHEVGHLIFLTMLRQGSRKPEGWNIAADIVINALIKQNKFELPKGGCIPDDDMAFRVKDEKTGNLIFEITDCNKKTGEQVYDELQKQAKQQGKSFGGGEGNEKIVIRIFNGHGGKGGKDDKGLSSGLRFDIHMQGKKGKLTPQEAKALQEVWTDRLYEALVIAKQRGTLPAGMELLVGKLHESKVDWRTLLQRYIESYIPWDYTWNKFSKKSIAADYPMPDTIKERIKVVVGIDTSGSIGEKELKDFLSEIVGIAKSFNDRISIRVLTHDVDVHTDNLAENGSIEQIMKTQIKGGGGTSHIPVFNHIKNSRETYEVAIFLTDGCSDLQDINFKDYNFEKIFVLSESGNDSQIKDKGVRIIRL